MKKTLLLIVIYLAFISLGLPDSLLGTAWPAMYGSLGVPAHYAGIIAMTIAGGTVISSLFSSVAIRRFGVPAITTFSVLLTALSLLGFSYSQHFVFLCLLAVPLGLGAGCVDAALNNYVALHYEARHMNWLHCFWGLGAALGPIIMASYLSRGQPWTAGYHTVGWIQVCLVLILLIATPLWVRSTGRPQAKDGEATAAGFRNLLRIPGVKQALVVFFCYCALEATFGLWGASYLVFSRGFAPDDAARLVSVYYIGITLGRFVSGFLADRFSNWQLVYFGQGGIALGVLVILLPFHISLLPGFLLVGLGCAPIFPSLLHETPRNFGAKHAQSVMGMQMASAYVGITLIPYLFGQLATYFTYSALLWFIGIGLALMVYMTFRLNRVVSSHAVGHS